eukprot:3862295-Pyramimonas_sp.AAC.1
MLVPLGVHASGESSQATTLRSLRAGHADAPAMGRGLGRPAAAATSSSSSSEVPRRPAAVTGPASGGRLPASAQDPLASGDGPSPAAAMS